MTSYYGCPCFIGLQIWPAVRSNTTCMHLSSPCLLVCEFSTLVQVNLFMPPGKTRYGYCSQLRTPRCKARKGRWAMMFFLSLVLSVFAVRGSTTSGSSSQSNVAANLAFLQTELAATSSAQQSIVRYLTQSHLIPIGQVILV